MKFLFPLSRLPPALVCSDSRLATPPFCVPKISLCSCSPSYCDCCNHGVLSSSGSVYQEEEEVSNICCWLKGTQCFKLQRELGNRQGECKGWLSENKVMGNQLRGHEAGVGTLHSWYWPTF